MVAGFCPGPHFKVARHALAEASSSPCPATVAIADAIDTRHEYHTRESEAIRTGSRP